jgi:hypothetical protein
MVRFPCSHLNELFSQFILLSYGTESLSLILKPDHFPEPLEESLAQCLGEFFHYYLSYRLSVVILDDERFVEFK